MAACIAVAGFGSIADARTVTDSTAGGLMAPMLPAIASAPVTATADMLDDKNIPAAQPAVARPMTIAVDNRELNVSSNAITVGAVLDAAAVRVGRDDIVVPSRDSAVPADGKIRVERVHAWTQRICSRLAPATLMQSAVGLAAGTKRVMSQGAAGLRQTTIRFSSIDGRPQRPEILAQRTLVAAKPRVIARGITPEPLAAFANGAVQRTGDIAHSALAMIATAYTAYCSGCSGTGRGATGMRVSHGVVAVDPSVIPLGSHLFIPGYGHAIAGDTGGAIVGHRIDLAFDSNDEAINFGRRPVQVYVIPSK